MKTRHLLLALSIVVACAGPRRGVSKVPTPEAPFEALLQVGESRQVPDTELTIELRAAEMAYATDEAGHDNHVFSAQLAVEAAGETAVLTLVNEAPVEWRGYRIAASAEGYAWSGPGAATILIETI